MSTKQIEFPLVISTHMALLLTDIGQRSGMALAECGAAVLGAAYTLLEVVLTRAEMHALLDRVGDEVDAANRQAIAHEATTRGGLS